MAKISLSKVLGGNWIITKVMQGYGGRIRIDAEARFHRADENNYFSEWYSLKYANRISREIRGKNVEITSY